MSQTTAEVTNNINRGHPGRPRKSSAGAVQVLSAARALTQQSDMLKGEVQKFLDRVRAA
ncbi:MAG: hypothetical protein WDN06_04710 [Asticcacaulis sp.]